MKGRLLNSSIQMLSSALFSVAALTAANAQAAVSQAPISLTVGVAPNLIFTLDDSGSMREAYTPEAIEDLAYSRRVKSSSFNTMYYNPQITYRIPKKYDENGLESGSYSTSFTNAYYNGFKPELGGLDLRTAYRVSWWYKPSIAHSNNFDATDPQYGYRQFADNPIQDFVEFTAPRENFSNQPRCDFNGYYTYFCESYWTWNGTRYRGERQQTSQNKTKQGVPAYYYKYNQSPGCTPDDDDCYSIVTVSNTSGIERADSTDGIDERKNFAIWYSFYRNRALATMSAARLAFAELSPSTRMTWQSLNACSILNSSRNCGDNRFREFTPAQRGRFFSWLDTLDFYQGTPLRAALGRAGEFLKTDTPWLKYPNDSSKSENKENNKENTYACRPSYHVLMTDGIWNGGNGSPSDTFKSDGSSFTLPDGEKYSPSRTPYGDDTDNTLADLAMHYWATDLSSLDNKLTPYMPAATGDETSDYWDPRNDPATWQHMVNFTMGLGLSSALREPGLEWDKEKGTFGGVGYTNLISGNKDWPTLNIGIDDEKKVYDLWHAAINSRGEFFSVDSPDTMVQAFEDILNRIADRKSSAARPAISSGIVIDDTALSISYQTSYASDENWAGDLKRYSKKLVQNDDGEYVLENTQDWSAQEKLPTHGKRTIKIADEHGADSSNLKDFEIGNAGDFRIEGTLAHYLNKNPEAAGDSEDGRWQERLSYIRGDGGKEGNDVGDFRQRTAVLGDLYGSSPVVVSGARYLEGFANRLEGHIGNDGKLVAGDSSYTAFIAKINGTEEGATKRTSRVYVGGNDGMLHGFNAETGIEEFAFIPTEVFPKLHKLTGKNYSHEFYVDGTPTVADIYDGSKWRTILVGTLRAGGKGLFALDVTTPGSEELLWEFDASDVDENGVKPGFSFSKPTIARLHDGKWAVVTGNGYENGATDGKAALYIIDAITGDLTRSLEVTGDQGTNGLSSPVLADYNADGIADYAYAGDLQGNLWRFDLLPTNNSDDDGDGYPDESSPLSRDTLSRSGTVTASHFKVGYGGKPMFQAKAGDGDNDAAQPITAAPTLIRHPSRIGNLVVFGTGKFFETEDKEGVKTHAQSVYGIWDTKTRAEPTSENTVKRDQLVKQDIEEEVTGTYTQGGTNPARIISNNPVKWTATDGNGVVSVNQYGWYLDLAVDGSNFEGEMVIEKISTLGQTLFFQSLVPNDDPCADGASNWTYALNPFTGGKTLFHAFDLRQVSDTGDASVVSGIKQDGEGGITITQNPDGTYEACTGLDCEEIFPDPASIGRQTWRIVGN